MNETEREIPLIMRRGSCLRNHPIHSEEDIFIHKDKKSKRGYRYTCKICHREDKMRWRGELAPLEKKHGNMVDKGMCGKGHPLLSEEDVYYTNQPGRNYKAVRCVQCRKEYERARGKPISKVVAGEFSGYNPPRESRHIILTCFHTNIFQPPYPPEDDIVFCQTCMNYQVVHSWGQKARRDGDAGT